MTMPVETNQWRATIGCLSSSVLSLFSLCKAVRLHSILFQVAELLYFSYFFIAILILALPISPIIVHFLAVHSMVTQLPFLPLLARIHHFAKSELYAFAEIFKRIPFGVFVFARKKYFHSQYAYHTACIACYLLHIQWAVFKINLLNGDIETNPGTETLSFCFWNLNTISAYDY